MSKRDLSRKRILFCHEYLLDDNATQAYIRAGYSKNGAKASASQLLANTDISAYIDKLRSERLDAINIGVEEIYAALWQNHITAESRGELNNSNAALQLCGRAKAMFTDKVEAKVEKYDEMSEADLDLLIAQKKKEIEAIHTH